MERVMPSGTPTRQDWFSPSAQYVSEEERAEFLSVIQGANWIPLARCTSHPMSQGMAVQGLIGHVKGTVSRCSYNLVYKGLAVIAAVAHYRTCDVLLFTLDDGTGLVPILGMVYEYTGNFK